MPTPMEKDKVRRTMAKKANRKSPLLPERTQPEPPPEPSDRDSRFQGAGEKSTPISVVARREGSGKKILPTILRLSALSGGFYIT
jgi:hypothetical protein